MHEEIQEEDAYIQRILSYCHAINIFDFCYYLFSRILLAEFLFVIIEYLLLLHYAGVYFISIF